MTIACNLGASDKDRRVFEIKGWYDEQRLGQLDVNGKLIPAAFKGTIIADPGLDDLDNTNSFHGRLDTGGKGSPGSSDRRSTGNI